MMHSTFHLSRGDALWFDAWVPQSTGALAGAAIGLFLLAILERWLAAMRVVMEAWWQQRCARAAIRYSHQTDLRMFLCTGLKLL